MDNITAKLDCDKIGHKQPIKGICLNIGCTDKRYICTQCLSAQHHRGHKIDCFTIDQLKDFIDFYDAQDNLNKRIVQIYKDYKQRIIENLNQMEELIVNLMKQRDIGLLNVEFLQSRFRSLGEFDHYARTLSKLVKQNSNRIERNNVFINQLENMLTNAYQSVIQLQVSNLDTLVKKFSLFTLIDYPNAPISTSQYKSIELVSPLAFRFIFTGSLKTPQVDVRDDFIARGKGTVMLQPSVDEIFQDVLVIRIHIQQGRQCSIGICTLDRSKQMSLIGKAFLIQADGYTFSSSRPDQNQQRRSFEFSTSDTIHCKYNKNTKCIEFINERSNEISNLSDIIVDEQLYFCIILNYCEVVVLNI